MKCETVYNSTEPKLNHPAIVSDVKAREAGFSLIEVCCALVIILIALLGVAFSFTYAINYNAGNKSRSHALAVLQQRVEQLRAAKFTPTVTDAVLTGGVKAAETVTVPSGERFKVEVTVDNDPLAAGIQTDATVPAPTLKEITVTTSLASPSPGWQTAVPSRVVLRRVRSN
jgi:prepilin-type N-terminal cleavage/methylation domain-containing protein